VDAVDGAAHRGLAIPELPEGRRHPAIVGQLAFVKVEGTEARDGEELFLEDGCSQRQTQIGGELADALQGSRIMNIRRLQVSSIAPRQDRSERILESRRPIIFAKFGMDAIGHRLEYAGKLIKEPTPAVPSQI